MGAVLTRLVLRPDAGEEDAHQQVRVLPQLRQCTVPDVCVCVRLSSDSGRGGLGV
jgi:hypothetical protein